MVTKNNASVRPAWGEAQSVEWTNEGYQLQGSDRSRGLSCGNREDLIQVMLQVVHVVLS